MPTDNTDLDKLLTCLAVNKYDKKFNKKNRRNRHTTYEDNHPNNNILQQDKPIEKITVKKLGYDDPSIQNDKIEFDIDLNQNEHNTDNDINNLLKLESKSKAYIIPSPCDNMEQSIQNTTILSEHDNYTNKHTDEHINNHIIQQDITIPYNPKIQDITNLSIESSAHPMLDNPHSNQIHQQNIALTNIDELLKDNNNLYTVPKPTNYKIHGDIKVYVPKQSNIKKIDVNSFYKSLSKKKEKIKEYLFKRNILSKIEQCPDRLLFILFLNDVLNDIQINYK